MQQSNVANNETREYKWDSKGNRVVCTHKGDVVFCKRTHWYSTGEKVGIGVGSTSGILIVLGCLTKIARKYL